MHIVDCSIEENQKKSFFSEATSYFVQTPRNSVRIQGQINLKKLHSLCLHILVPKQDYSTAHHKMKTLTRWH